MNSAVDKPNKDLTLTIEEKYIDKISVRDLYNEIKNATYIRCIETFNDEKSSRIANRVAIRNTWNMFNKIKNATNRSTKDYPGLFIVAKIDLREEQIPSAIYICLKKKERQ